MSYGISITNSDGTIQIDQDSLALYLIASGTLSNKNTGLVYGGSSNTSGNSIPGTIGTFATISFPTQITLPIVMFNGVRVTCRNLTLSSFDAQWMGSGGTYIVLSTSPPATVPTNGLQMYNSSGQKLFSSDQKLFVVDGLVSSSNAVANYTTIFTGLMVPGHISAIDAGFSVATLPTPPSGSIRYSTADYYDYNPQNRMHGYWANSTSLVGWIRGSGGSFTISQTQVRTALVAYEVGGYASYTDYGAPMHSILTGYINL